jgi:hypothetical protein
VNRGLYIRNGPARQYDPRRLEQDRIVWDSRKAEYTRNRARERRYRYVSGTPGLATGLLYTALWLAFAFAFIH